MNVNYKELYEQNIDSVRKRYPQKDPVEINLQNSFGDKLKLLDFNNVFSMSNIRDFLVS